MKKFLAFAFIISAFTVLGIFAAEKSDILGLKSIRMNFSFTENADGSLTLSWVPLPYPCFYKVEVFSHTTGLVPGAPKYHHITDGYTMSSDYVVPSSAIPMFYRVNAYGIFEKLNEPTELVANPIYDEPIKPVPIYRYTNEKKASRMPFLVWHTVPAAVCYEVEILSGLPEAEGGTQISKTRHLFGTRQVYTNGWQADLRPFKNVSHIFWRVRALGLHHEPIGEFSRAEPIVIDENAPLPDRPLVNNFDQMPDFEQPLYPVYEWIPLNGISRYEVELMIKPPYPNDTKPTAERIWYKEIVGASTCYDEYSRPYAGEYYWRVRAIDDKGNTIGRYSDAEKFVVKSHATRIDAAIFGDSITHGGGAVSYPPSSLEYSYGTYLDFPVRNLGRSGDTSHTSLLRFDEDVLPLQPKNLLILMGSNSLRAEGTAADDIIKDLSAIKKRCEENDIRPIFLTLMPINPDNIAYVFHTDTDPKWKTKMDMVNNFIKQQPYYIDLEPYFYDRSRRVLDYGLSSDGLHPDIKGKMVMGEIINLHKNLLKQ